MNEKIGGFILVKTCWMKKCKKPTDWVFFNDQLGFFESCEKHKTNVVSEIVKQIINFDFKQFDNLSN